jgi:hypothetical protein
VTFKISPGGVQPADQKRSDLMLIAIKHDIHDAAKFQQNAEGVFPLPEDFHVHHFFPAKDLSEAVCLYEAPSIDRLSDYLDGKLGDSSTQRYFPISEESAIGVPQRQSAR